MVTWRSRKLNLGLGDQRRIEIDADHLMPERRETSANSAGATSSVEDSRAARNHRIHKPSLAVEVLALGRHLLEPVDVPSGMPRVLLDHLQPNVCAHGATVPDGPKLPGCPRRSANVDCFP